MAIQWKHPTLKVTGEMRFDVNVICDLEARMKMSIAEVVTVLQAPVGAPIGAVRALVWAALGHLGGPVGRPSIEQVGQMIDEQDLGVVMQEAAGGLAAWLKRYSAKAE